MQKMRKKGSVIFLWIVVLLAIAALLFLLFQFNNAIGDNDKYVIDNKLRNGFGSFSSLSGALMYFDYASEITGNQVAMKLSENMIMKPGCLTEGSLLKVSPICNLSSPLKESYIKLFDEQFKESYQKYPEDEKIFLGMTTPKDFEYYFFNDKFHIVSYDSISLTSGESQLITKPSFEFPMPLNFSKIDQNFETAKIFDKDCREVSDYDECIIGKVNTMDNWEIIPNTLEKLPPLTSFIEQWFNCIDTEDTNCTCDINVNSFKDSDLWLSISQNSFKIIKGSGNNGVKIDEVQKLFSKGLCNIHHNGVFDRNEIRLKRDGDKINFLVSEKPRKWGSADMKLPLQMLVYDNQSNERKACLLTTSLGTAIKKVNIKDINDVKECKPAHDLIYVMINSTRNVFDSLGNYTNPKFYFVFEG
jgi:hypothetical protein